MIAHPFFSLFNYLYKIQKDYGLTDKDDRYLRIKHACFWVLGEKGQPGGLE